MKHFLVPFLMIASLALPAFAEDASRTVGIKETVICENYRNVLADIKNRFKENPMAFGVSNKTGELVILTAKPDLSTWTIIRVNKDGDVCSFDHGLGWQEKPEWGATG